MTKHSTDITGVIDGLLRQWKLTRASREQMVFGVWEQAVGELARHAQPRAIAGGRLTVAVQDSVWMQQLHFQKDEIKKSVNRLLGGSVVKEVKFTTRSFAPPAPVAIEKPIDPLEPDLEADARAAAERISDPELREQALAAFLALARLHGRDRS